MTRFPLLSLAFLALFFSMALCEGRRAKMADEDKEHEEAQDSARRMGKFRKNYFKVWSTLEKNNNVLFQCPLFKL